MGLPLREAGLSFCSRRRPRLRSWASPWRGGRAACHALQAGHVRLRWHPLAGGKPHPRLYGTFPRVLGRYVREERLLPLEEAVRKMTSLPARKHHLRERGGLRPGFSPTFASSTRRGSLTKPPTRSRGGTRRHPLRHRQRSAGRGWRRPQRRSAWAGAPARGLKSHAFRSD